MSIENARVDRKKYRAWMYRVGNNIEGKIGRGGISIECENVSSIFREASDL